MLTGSYKTISVTVMIIFCESLVYDVNMKIANNIINGNVIPNYTEITYTARQVLMELQMQSKETPHIVHADHHEDRNELA